MLVVFIILLPAIVSQLHAETSEPCRTESALRMLERAMQSRDDFFLWEDIDPQEASAELERYLFRLDQLQQYVADCAHRQPGIAALQWRVRASLRQAQDIANARRSAANKEASTR